MAGAAPGNCATSTSTTPTPTTSDLPPEHCIFKGEKVLDVNPNAWLQECADKLNLVKEDPWLYSNFNFIYQPSGLCTDAMACAFVQCGWTNKTTEILSKRPTDFADINMSELNPFPLNLPAKIVFPVSVGDIVCAVDYANENDLQISVKTSGHSYLGSSTMQGSLQINLRDFPKSSHEGGIVTCPSEADWPSSYSDLKTCPCKLARARGRSAVVRVGGGELWDEVYRAVMDWNAAVPGRNTTYDIYGGGAGSVGAAGGWLQGGGLCMGQERKAGIGIDRVLQLEMVLASGKHVKFGPTLWSNETSKLYPQTRAVSGSCNDNVHGDPAKWNWTTCEIEIPFKDLWKAVRGGGGGTYGIVTAVTYQLEDYEPYNPINLDYDALVAPFYKNQSQGKPVNMTVEVFKQKIYRFVLYFLFRPTFFNISGLEAYSNSCGNSAPMLAFDGSKSPERILLCLGNASWKDGEHGFQKAWNKFIDLDKETAETDEEREWWEYFKVPNPAIWTGGVWFNQRELFYLNESDGHWYHGNNKSQLTLADWGWEAMMTQAYPKWLSDNHALNQIIADYTPFGNPPVKDPPYMIKRGVVPIGRVQDYERPNIPGMASGRLAFLFPIDIIAREVPGLTDLFLVDLAKIGWPFSLHIMGGQVNFSSDGMDSVSTRYRTAAFQSYLQPTSMGTGGWNAASAAQWEPTVLALYKILFNSTWNFSYVRKNNDSDFEFLGGYEFNHMSPDMVGPLISETYGENTTWCPSDFNATQRKEKCLSPQLMVWGNETLDFLIRAKNTFDPDNRFNCTFCVGNDFRPIMPRPIKYT
eukprot:TRINITY_DN29126_c0_g1_i1.p1 TRINITY_DN29126_c0_g1~~TRINITY_DN29126_c0_g1_i1.p1  ORF type:complete len:840 (-),score=83.96 TRINITY_DN29126_c0_g1_i1:99-2522(-)